MRFPAEDFRKKAGLKQGRKVGRDTVSNALTKIRKQYQKKDRLEATAALQRVIPLLSRAHRTTEFVDYVDSFQFRGPAALTMEWN